MASLYYMGRLNALNIKGSGATVGFASEADYPMTYDPVANRVIVRDPVHNHGQCMYQSNSPFPWGQGQPGPDAAQLLIDVGPLSEKDMTYLFQQNRAPFATTMFVPESFMLIRSCCGPDDFPAEDENDPCYGKSIESYGTSVYTNAGECLEGSVAANHAVVAVGMGTTSGQTPFWYIRNSWGVRWGDKGHVRLLRDSTNYHVPGTDDDRPGGMAMCSLGYMNSYPRAKSSVVDDCVRFQFN